MKRDKVEKSENCSSFKSYFGLGFLEAELQTAILVWEILFFFIYLFIYFWLHWFIILLSYLCCCAQAFCSCKAQGPLLVAVYGFLTVWLLLLRSTGSRHSDSVVVVRSLRACRLQSLWHRDSRAWLQKLWYAGSVPSQHVESSWTRDQTHNPCISRQIPIHCATQVWEILSEEGNKHWTVVLTKV